MANLGACRQCGGKLAVLMTLGSRASVGCQTCHLPHPEHQYQKEIDTAWQAHQEARERLDRRERDNPPPAAQVLTEASLTPQLDRRLADLEKRIAALEKAQAPPQNRREREPAAGRR